MRYPATPSHRELGDPAGLLVRLFAKWLDYLAIGVVGGVAIGFKLPVTLIGIAWAIYQIYLIQAPEYGGTVGKVIFGIRIISVRDDKVGWFAAILRTVAEWMMPLLIFGATLLFAGAATLLLNPLLGVGVACLGYLALVFFPLFNVRRRAIHDFIAGTEVVQTERVFWARGLISMVVAVGLITLMPSPPEGSRVAKLKKKGRNSIQTAQLQDSLKNLLQGKPIPAPQETQKTSDGKIWNPLPGVAMAEFDYLPHAEGGVDPCQNTRYCITAYVTPWCPSCEQTKPTLKRIQNTFRGPDVGVQVVMGQDRPFKLEHACRDYGPNCMVDWKGEISSALKIHSYPTYLVWNRAERKLIDRPRAFVVEQQVDDQAFRELVITRFHLKLAQ